MNLYSLKMDGIGRHRALHTLKGSFVDKNGRHRALYTLKGSFLIKMDGIGPYILLWICFSETLKAWGLTVPAS